MIPVTLKTPAEISGGQLHGSDLTIADVTTDTRKVTRSLFVALVGERLMRTILPPTLSPVAQRRCW